MRVSYVIDTMGKVSSRSFTVVRSSNPLFSLAVRNAVTRTALATIARDLPRVSDPTSQHATLCVRMFDGSSSWTPVDPTTLQYLSTAGVHAVGRDDCPRGSDWIFTAHDSVGVRLPPEKVIEPYTINVAWIYPWTRTVIAIERERIGASAT